MRCLEIYEFICHATQQVYVIFPLYLCFAMILRFIGTHDEF